MQIVLAAGVFEINADSALPHVLLQEVTALAVDEIGMGPSGLAGGRAFHLDDIGAHGGQAPGQMGPGQEMAVINHPEALKGQGTARVHNRQPSSALLPKIVELISNII